MTNILLIKIYADDLVIILKIRGRKGSMMSIPFLDCCTISLHVLGFLPSTYYIFENCSSA
jgi:hypothetical protein